MFVLKKIYTYNKTTLKKYSAWKQNLPQYHNAPNFKLLTLILKSD